MSAVKTVMKNFARNAELDEFLQKELADAGYAAVDVVKTPMGTRITLYVSRPGLVIGRRGMGIKELTEKLQKKFGLSDPQIAVTEVDVPELNPRIMCTRIASSVTRGIAFRRAAISALNRIMEAGALGAEVSVAGKLRSERSHHEKYRAGIVPKSGDSATRTVREATTDVLLKMGLYGIKVKISLKDAIPSEFELLESSKTAEVAQKEVEAVAKTEGQ